jgi:DNA polymerase phi
VEKLFASSNVKDGKRKKKRKSEGPKGDDTVEDDVEPITAIVDVIIGYLEKSSSYLRSVANQSFGLMTSEVDKATADLILAVCIMTSVRPA